MKPGAILLLGAALLAAVPAAAQTRFAIAGGVLVPFGDLEDSTDPSLRAALRAEHQPVNALGKPSSLAFLFQVAYSDLSLKSEVEDYLVARGEDAEPYLLEVGGAVRVYSRAAPFFVTGGASYARYRPPGDSDGLSGLDLYGGVGFLLPAGIVLVEPEVSGHVVLLEEGDFQFLSATLGFALPF